MISDTNPYPNPTTVYESPVLSYNPNQSDYRSSGWSICRSKAQKVFGMLSKKKTYRLIFSFEKKKGAYKKLRIRWDDQPHDIEVKVKGKWTDLEVPEVIVRQWYKGQKYIWVKFMRM